MGRILLLEDQELYQKMVQKALESEYEVHVVDSLSVALEHLTTHSYDLILLDRAVSDGDSLQLCQTIRQSANWQNLPVIFLTGKTEESEKIAGFFAGADDYITKPFSPLELKARIQAQLRKFQRRIVVGDVEINPAAMQVYQLKGETRVEISLTSTEYRLLLALVRSPDQVFTRERLLDQVWGQEFNITDRVIDTHMSHLRKKLKHSQLQIKSVYNEGYRLVLNVSFTKASA